MQFISWCYSHIIRATGVSALGLLEITKKGDNLENTHQEEEDFNEVRMYVNIIKRLFELTLHHAESKIESFEKSNKGKKIVEELKLIVEDCKSILKQFESYNLKGKK